MGQCTLTVNQGRVAQNVFGIDQDFAKFSFDFTGFLFWGQLQS